MGLISLPPLMEPHKAQPLPALIWEMVKHSVLLPLWLLARMNYAQATCSKLAVSDASSLPLNHPFQDGQRWIALRLTRRVPSPDKECSFLNESALPIIGLSD